MSKHYSRRIGLALTLQIVTAFCFIFIISLFQKCSAYTPQRNSGKRIVFIRHGCTFANEFLAQPGTGWGDPTFKDTVDLRDSELSPTGIRQALKLREQIVDGRFPVNVDEIDLVVVSPLSRTLQTFELSLYPQMMKKESGEKIPIVALPLARERLYMISDMGLTTSELKAKFSWADFDSEFPDEETQQRWWYTRRDEWEGYQEWRPHGQGQQYLVPGEPDDVFEDRMTSLREWLGKREEKTIVVVCHWGVLEWLTGIDFDNCEVKVVEYDKLASIQKKTLFSHLKNLIKMSGA